MWPPRFRNRRWLIAWLVVSGALLLLPFLCTLAPSDTPQARVERGPWVGNLEVAPGMIATGMNLRGSEFVARIGLHDGPIIGGIVGRERIRYGIFGDAVNTAQRLETACDPGGICISQSMHEILNQTPHGSEFELTSHGEITPKGKPAMMVWHLASLRQTA